MRARRLSRTAIPDQAVPVLGTTQTEVYRGSWDWTITPTLLNRFYGGFNHFREDHGSLAVNHRLAAERRGLAA